LQLKAFQAAAAAAAAIATAEAAADAFLPSDPSCLCCRILSFCQLDAKVLSRNISLHLQVPTDATPGKTRQPQGVPIEPAQGWQGKGSVEGE